MILFQYMGFAIVRGKGETSCSRDWENTWLWIFSMDNTWKAGTWKTEKDIGR